MGTTQSIVHTRRIDDSKLSRAMATSQLEQVRGFSVAPESTFHQTRKGVVDTLGRSVRYDGDDLHPVILCPVDSTLPSIKAPQRGR